MAKDAIPHKRVLLALLLLIVAVLFPVQLPAGDILIFGPTLAPPELGFTTTEETIAQSQGHTVTISYPGSPPFDWNLLTSEQFASFDAIVFADRGCVDTPIVGPEVFNGAVANRSVWSAAIQGNIVIMGNSPIDRIRRGDSQGQAEQLVRNGINFAVSGTGTGLYMSLSCYYFLFTSEQQVEVLGGLGDFRVFPGSQPAPSCPNNVTITDPEHPVMAGLTGSGLSNWECSMREWFTVFPSNFRVLATETNRPYILATGVVGVTVRTNPSANAGIGAPSANIVRGDGTDQSTLYISLEPPAQTTVQLSADFGGVPASVQTNASGKASATYTSGVAPQDATTTIATATATTSGNEGSTEVYNLLGFSGFDFHQAQVSDARYLDHTEWGVNEVQAFFILRNSFFRRFYLVGNKGDRGFYDADNSQGYTSGDPKYCADETTTCSMNGQITSAAQAFIDAATKRDQKVDQRVNPKLLITMAQKERSVVSKETLPAARDLNRALGCGTFNTFGSQLNCGAQSLQNRFNEAPTAMPHFFPLSRRIKHFVYNTSVSRGQQPVAFPINTRATFGLYGYNSFIEEEQGGGGFYLFENVWQGFQF